MKKLIALAGMIVLVSFSTQKSEAQPYRTYDNGSGGGEMGGGLPDFMRDDPYFDDLYMYCDRTAVYLERAVVRSTNRRRDPGERRQVLVTALREIERGYNRISHSIDPLTRDAISRGIELDSAFSGACVGRHNTPSCRIFEDERAYIFLVTYIEYILNVVIPLDLDYLMPFQHGNTCYGIDNCDRDIWMHSLYVHYRDSAIELIRLYAGNNGARAGLPFSFGRDRYELQVAEKISYYAMEDLNRSGWRRSFSCAIQDLDVLNEDLYNFNHRHRRDMFVNSRDAIDWSRHLLVSLSRELSLDSCFGEFPENTYPRNDRYRGHDNRNNRDGDVILDSSERIYPLRHRRN